MPTKTKAPKKRRIVRPKPEPKKKDARVRYSAEFKDQVLQRVMGGETVTSVAEDTGVSEPSIYQWLRKTRQSDPAAPATRRAGGTTVKLGPDELRRITEGMETFSAVGFQTDPSHLVSLALDHADWKALLSEHVSEIQNRLKKF